MAEDDLYERLGVSRTASDEEIKRAYRRLAKKYHPDRNPGDKHAEEMFKKINEAYEILSNPEKRANYDRYGTPDGPGAGMEGWSFSFGSGFEDLEEILSGFFGGRSRRRSRSGEDLQLEIELTFDEAFFGCEKDISFYRYVPCEKCNGTGAKKGTSPRTCPTCRGRGIDPRYGLGLFGARACPTCRGTGEIIDNPCNTCHGTGLVKKKIETTVRIPPGVENGVTQVIRGSGHFGPRGGPPGRMLVAFRVKPHKIFIRRGLHVYMELEIPFSIAVLGGKVEVPTMWGKSEINVKPGTEGQTLFRMRGKGVHTNDGRQGDQLVRVKIKIPKKLTKEQKRYLEKFNEIFD